MIKVGRFLRSSIVEKLKKDIASCDNLFVVQYSGLGAVGLDLLRGALRASRARLLVTKNTLIRRALGDAQREGLNTFVDGPTALVFGCDDIADTSKVLTKFAQENQALILKGGFFRERILDKKDIEAIAKLPSCGALRAQVVLALKSPLAGLVFTLQGTLNKLVIVLEQIRIEKEKKPETSNQ